MEVGVKIESENPFTGDASAYLTFVSLNEKGKPTEVPDIYISWKERKILK